MAELSFGVQDKDFEAVITDEELRHYQPLVNEDPRTRDQSVEKLKSWLLEQKHFTARTDDAFLLAFLRRNHYDLERAQLNLERFVFYQCAHPSIPFRVPSSRHFTDKHYDLLDAGVAFTLPRRTSEGRRVIVMRIGKWNPSKYSADLLIQTKGLVASVLGEDLCTTLAGAVYVHDCSGVGLKHLALPKGFFKHMNQFAHEVAPWHLREHHVVNAGLMGNVFTQFLKLVTGKKLESKIHVHWKGPNRLNRHINAEVLPAEYGGSAGALDDIIKSHAAFVRSHVSLYDRNSALQYTNDKQCLLPEDDEQEEEKLQDLEQQIREQTVS